MIAPTQEEQVPQETPAIDPQITATKKILEQLRANTDIQVNEKIRDQLESVLGENSPGQFREGFNSLVINASNKLPPRSEAFDALDKAQTEMGYGQTIPENAVVNIKGLMAHRPRYAGNANNELGGALNHLIQKAEKNDTEGFNKELDYIIHNVRTDPQYRNVPGHEGNSNSREDVLSVLNAIRAGKSDLSDLPIHERDHRKEGKIDHATGTTIPTLRGLPGVEYHSEEPKTGMAPHPMDELVAQAGVKPIEGVAHTALDSQVLGVGSVPRKPGSVEIS